MRTRLLLVAAALVAFGASLGSGFHFDDYDIFSDAALQSPRGWMDIWSIRQTRPLTFLSFWLNGYNPTAMHAVNLLLHLAAVLLAFECLRRLLPERTALIAAAIFAVHPLQAEAVDYIWGRSIVLAAVFCFACLLCWLTGRRWMAVACFAAALLAKEEAAAFPLFLLWLALADLSGESWWGRLPGLRRTTGPAELKVRPAVPPGWRDRGKIGIMLALSFAAGVRVIYALAITPGAPAGAQAGISPWHYFLAQGPVIWRYVRLFVAPIGFSVDPQIAIPSIWAGLGCWAAILILPLVKQLGRLRFWLMAGFILLLPSSSIFPAADLAADRRMYLPLFAFAVAAAMVLEAVNWRWVVVAALAAVSVSRTYVWMSDERLWREAVESSPDKVRPKIQLSRSVPSPEALTLLQDARRVAPNDPAVAAEAGKVLLSAGQPAAALGEFGRALALAPRDPVNLNNRGVALAALGQTEAARRDFESALALDPQLATARENLQKLPPAR